MSASETVMDAVLLLQEDIKKLELQRAYLELRILQKQKAIEDMLHTGDIRAQEAVDNKRRSVRRF